MKIEEEKKDKIENVKQQVQGDKVNEEQTKCYCGHTTYCDCGPEQETLFETFKNK